MPPDTYKSLEEYLLAHEIDIAVGSNDFGELKQSFVEFFDREPTEA